jgi:flagellar FliL protein
MAKDKEKKDEKEAKEEKVPLTPEEEAAKAKKKKLIIFGAVGFLVIAGGAAAAFMFLGGDSKKPAEVTPTEVDPNAEEDSLAATKTKTPADDKKKNDEASGEKNAGEPGAEGKPAEAAPVEYKGDFGLIKEFKPFHLNLGNPLENRYVRVTIGVEYKNGPDQLIELNRREPQLRDAVVSIISRKTREHLLSPDGKDQLRLEIKNKLNQYLDSKIDNIFITDILIE